MEKGERRFLPAGVVTAIFAVALISGFFSVPFAAAQEEKPKQETAQPARNASQREAGGEEKARGEYELGTTTVTAQKQEENVQEVPLSITLFNELDIEDKKITNMGELADYVPNLTLSEMGMSGWYVPSMRGISASQFQMNVATGLYVDGVPILAPIGFETGMFDIERIEVLRGPQGTLYGKNAEAGVISITTRQPDNEFRGRVSAEGGEDKKGQLSFNLSGPIQKDRFYVGIAGEYYQKDGFIENTTTGDMVDDREHLSGKGHLRWTPNDNLDISLIASFTEYDDGARRTNLTEQGAAMFYVPAPQDRKVSSNLEGWNKSKVDSQALKITYDISDSFTLTSVSTRRQNDWIDETDFDYSSTTVQHIKRDNKYNKLSQELRLNSTTEHLKWLVGLYYDKDHNEEVFSYKSIYLPTPFLGDQEYDGDAYAAFTHITYALTERFSLVGGLRYEKQEQEFTDHASNRNFDDSWGGLTPKIALEYLFTPAIMTYVSASKGFRSGGFNAFTMDPQYFSYDEEQLWSYDIGIKSAFLDNKLIINGSVFYMDITDMQVEETPSATETYTSNAAEATGKGVELEITAIVTDGLSIMGGFGYTDIEFDKFSDAQGDYKGNKNLNAPEYTFNIGAQYRHTSGFYARADLIGYGEMFFDAANEYSRDPYEIVNAKIGYEAKSFDVYLYAKNLFDEEYDSAGYYGGSYVVYSDPGEVGLQVVYRF